MRRLITGGLLAALLVPEIATATLYRWVDGDGVAHYTTERETIPAARRGDAVEIEHPQARTGPVPAMPGAGAATPGPGAPATVPAETEPSATPAGTQVIRFSPGGPIVVPAHLNGVPLVLVVDTGADRTVISPAAMTRAGFEVRGEVVNITGVTGTAAATLASVPALDVAGARVGPLAVVVHDSGLQGADGLLGRDVLDAFTFTVDAALGRATLAPR